MRPLARPQRDGVSQPARRRRTVHQPAEESVMEGSQRGRQKRAFQGEMGYKRIFYRAKVTKGNTPEKVKKHICAPSYSTGRAERGQWPREGLYIQVAKLKNSVLKGVCMCVL